LKRKKGRAQSAQKRKYEEAKVWSKKKMRDGRGTKKGGRGWGL